MRTTFEEMERRAQKLRDSSIGKAMKITLQEAKVIVEIVMTQDELKAAGKAS